MRMRPILAAAATVAALAAGPAAADTRLARESSPATSLTADHGVVAWLSGDFELRIGLAVGERVRHPDTPRNIGSTIDAGRDASGRDVLTFARCARRRRNCRPWSLDVATGALRRIPGIERRGCEIPAVARSGSTIAFVRVAAPGRRCRAGLFARSAGRVRRIGTPAGGGVSGIDVEGDEVALVTSSYRAGRERDVLTTQLLLATTGGRERLSRRVSQEIGEDSQRDGTALASPSLDGGFAYWLTTRAESLGSEAPSLSRLALGGDGAEEEGGGQQGRERVVVDGGVAYYADDEGGVFRAEALPPFAPR